MDDIQTVESDTLRNIHFFIGSNIARILDEKINLFEKIYTFLLKNNKLFTDFNNKHKILINKCI